MEFLSQLNLEQLGTTGVVVAILAWQNWELRKDLREEREYNRQINRFYQESISQVRETVQQVHQALAVLAERLK